MESGSGGRSDFFRVCKEWSDLSTPNYNHSFTGQRREYKGRVRLRNRTNFRKGAKGGGVILNPKIYFADFGNFKQGSESMKLIQKD